MDDERELGLIIDAPIVDVGDEYVDMEVYMQQQREQRVPAVRWFRRVWRPYFDVEPLVIYGKAWSLPQVMLMEAAHYDDTDGPEYESLVAGMKRLYDRGGVWTFSYSVACPSGEYGSQMVSELEWIDEAEFQSAMQQGWML